MSDLTLAYRERIKTAFWVGWLIGISTGLIGAIGLSAWFSGLCAAVAAASPLKIL